MKRLLPGLFLYCLCLTCQIPVLANQGTVNLVVNILLLQGESQISKSLSLSWQHPGQREDGTSLEVSELKNYQIRYRLLDSAAPYRLILLDGAQLSTSLALNGQVGDQYEFAVRTIDKDGLGSAYTQSAFVAFTEAEPGR